ncbi:MAG: hypothetical protein ACJAR0_003694 [Candidatus Azotimanducaceae bacterium]|jgi:hypothetical protein
MNNEPNIFNYATSELSNDAVLCWLFEYLNPQFKNEPEHQVAKALYREIRNVASSLPESPMEVIVHRQVKGADILIKIDDINALLIEDKTYSSAHSDQLKKYREMMESPEKLKGFEHVKNVEFVYLKTGVMHQWEIAECEDKRNNYKIVDWLAIERFIDAIPGECLQNALVSQYTSYLKTKFEQRYYWSHKRIEQWTDETWESLLHILCGELGKSDWGYVNNARGGFYALWSESAPTYMQLEIGSTLEDTKLAFRISVGESTRRSDIRDDALFRISEVSKQPPHNALRIDAPARRGSGETMTFAVARPALVFRSDGLLNFNATLETLRLAKALASDLNQH